MAVKEPSVQPDTCNRVESRTAPGQVPCKLFINSQRSGAAVGAAFGDAGAAGGAIANGAGMTSGSEGAVGGWILDVGTGATGVCAKPTTAGNGSAAVSLCPNDKAAAKIRHGNIETSTGPAQGAFCSCRGQDFPG